MQQRYLHFHHCINNQQIYCSMSVFTQLTRCFRLNMPNISHQSSECTSAMCSKARMWPVIDVGEVILVIGAFVQGVSAAKSCITQHNVSSL